jgi:hypothetical protein
VGREAATAATAAVAAKKKEKSQREDPLSIAIIVVESSSSSSAFLSVTSHPSITPLCYKYVRLRRYRIAKVRSRHPHALSR